MFRKIFSTLRWSLSLGNKFFQVVPGATLIVVFSTLISQVSMLLAFLLPLKVVMLLGSSGIPRYFPSSFADFDRDALVVALSLSAVGFYVAYALAEKVVLHSSCRGASLLLGKSQKMILFENQEEMASRAYQRYSKILASSVLILVVFLAICFLYSELFLVLCGYIVFVGFVLWGGYSALEKFKVNIEEEPAKIANTATSIGFLLAFSFMVSQFLWGTPPGLLVAVISLILMRQGFSRVTGIVSDVKGLYSQRLKLNALFFHGHVLISETKKHEVSLWSMLEPEVCKSWVCDVLEEAVDQDFSRVDVQWYQLGVQDVVALKARAFLEEGEVGGEYFVKVFNKNKSSQAKHEATLLSCNSAWPSLLLVSVTEFEGMHCHVFRWVEAEKLSSKNVKEARKDVGVCLLEIEPEKVLVERYSRSRPPLWQRIDQKLLDRLKTVAGMLEKGDISKVEDLISHRDSVVAILQRLPLSVVNPDLQLDMMMRNEEREILALHWGRWSLEPIGAGWPVQSEQLKLLGRMLEKSKCKRSSLRSINENGAYLAALVFELEKLCLRQNFLPAIQLIPKIIACVESDANTKETLHK